jgi:hypothetical protein
VNESGRTRISRASGLFLCSGGSRTPPDEYFRRADASILSAADGRPSHDSPTAAFLADSCGSPLANGATLPIYPPDFMELSSGETYLFSGEIAQ